MPNRLAAATSPYLLQHADNPVDWFEWGEDAFTDARRRDRPILLSVGYAACHWCHVMAHESFEDEAMAALMNRLFVNVKVDREERPDVDRVYMDAVQATTGRGGWPMTVFLTPDGEPFFAGTYFPPQDHGEMPSFRRVMEAVDDAWVNRRDEVGAQAARIAAVVRREPPPGEAAPGAEALESAYRALESAYDPDHGGFGPAPKFPQPGALEFLLRVCGEPWAPRAAEMLGHTLTAMAAGGIYDHLGGGFSRYSVDRRWEVPHFEKMLYDNSLLARIYLRAHQVTGDPDLARIAGETLDYIMRDLGLPGGGFASSEDADSEGEEGRFYTFTLEEFLKITGEHSGAAGPHFGVTAAGDLEGRNVLRRALTVEQAATRAGLEPSRTEHAVAEAHQLLRRARARRVRPFRDDKVVCAWNGMAIRALAEAAFVLDDERYLSGAIAAARFVLQNLRSGEGRLMRSWREGRVSGPAFADDHGALALGLFAVYEATGDDAWYREAERITTDLVGLFWDDEQGGVHATGRDAERLIARPVNQFDNPTPSDNSLAAEALARLAAATGDTALFDRIEAIGRRSALLVERAPDAAGHLLAVLHSTAKQQELAIVGDPADPRTGALLAEVRSRFRPEVFVAMADPAHPVTAVPLLRHRQAGPEGTPLAYLCRRFACEEPTPDPSVLGRLLDANGAPIPSDRLPSRRETTTFRESRRRG